MLYIINQINKTFMNTFMNTVWWELWFKVFDENKDWNLNKKELSEISNNLKEENNKLKKEIDSLINKLGDQYWYSINEGGYFKFLQNNHNKELQKAITNYTKSRESIMNDTKNETLIESENFSENEQIIANFSEKEDKKNREKILELQKSLNELWYTDEKWNMLDVDGIWGKKTKISFNQAEEKIVDKIPESQFKGSWDKPSIETDGRHNNLGNLTEQIDLTKRSVLDLRSKLEITAELNKNFESYFFRENSGYSIESAIRKLSWNDKFNEISKGSQEIEELLKKEWNKEKLEKAIMFLSSDYNEWNNQLGEEYDDLLSWNQVIDNETLWHIWKSLPWLFGIYLGDIPLSFMKKIIPWADINKSVPFKNWIKDGMEWTFEEYYKANKTEITVLENQYTLRWLVTTLKLNNAEQSKLLSGNLKWLTEETKKLLVTYIKERLVPDLQIMHNESFNWFEREWWLNIFTDEKSVIIKTLLDKMLSDENSSSGNLKFSEEVIKLLEKEWDLNDWVMNSTINRNNYMGEVLTQNQIFEKVSWLSEKWVEFQNLSILLFTNKIWWINNFGLSPKDKVLLNEAYNYIISGNENGLKELMNNTQLKTITKNLLTKNHKKYLLSQINEHDNLEYHNVWIAKHGLSLDDINLTNDEAYNIAITTTPEKGSKISSLDNAYKSLIEKWEIYWISNNDFHQSFKNKENIWINDITTEPIINTGRKEHQKTLSSFQELITSRWDTFIIKWAPIEKEYTFFSDWKKITEKVTYNIYMRPDCQNPLIVPSSIITVTEKNIMNFDTNTLTTVDGKFPVVIPWFLIDRWTKWNWHKGDSTTPRGDSTTPGEEIWGDIWGGGGVPGIEIGTGRT